MDSPAKEMAFRNGAETFPACNRGQRIKQLKSPHYLPSGGKSGRRLCMPQAGHQVAGRSYQAGPWFCYVRTLQLGKCGMGEEGQQRLMETQMVRLTKGPNIGILHRGQQVNLAGIVPVSLIPINLVPIGIQGGIPALHCEGTL